MHKIGICTVYVIFTGLKLEITTRINAWSMFTYGRHRAWTKNSFQNSSKQSKLKTFCHSSFEFQTKNYFPCFGHICNHPHGQENCTQKYINTVLITV